MRVVRERLACKARGIRRTFDVLFANLRTFTRHTALLNVNHPSPDRRRTTAPA